MSFIYKWHKEEIAKIIDDFLPSKLFDSHMHISHKGFESIESDDRVIDINLYQKEMRKIAGERHIISNCITYPINALKNKTEFEKSLKFLYEQLKLHPENVGEIMVMPGDSAEDIEKRLIAENICGLKCYWIYSQSSDGDQSDICDYLPEAAWEVANRRHMCITLHMVKNRALADKENMQYIKNMAKKYPDAILILAHCGRAFASWTAFDTVDELVDFENIYFDFSGICEPAAMMYIIKKAGIKRCMWGSDYPISHFVGKAISIADFFCWLDKNFINSFCPQNKADAWLVGVEGIMAIRQAGKILDLGKNDMEDFFYNNAETVLLRKNK